MSFLGALVILLATFCGVSGAQNSSQDNSCFAYSVNKLTPCAPYLAPGDAKKYTSINESCCQGLRDLFNEKPPCICFLIELNNGLPSFIDPKKALYLPGPCNASVPPINRCFGAGSPGGAPRAQPPPVAKAGHSAGAFLAGTLIAAVVPFI